MNHRVPDFETDEDYSIPASNSGLMRPKKSAMGGDEDIMELLWQNGQVVMQSQNQRSGGKNNKPPHNGDLFEQTLPFSREIRSAAEVEEATPSHLFMQEEEMASWLHYPMDDSSIDRYLYSDLLYPPPVSAPISLPPTSTVTVAPRPPIPPSRRVEPEPPAKSQNFVHFSRPRTESGGPSTPNKTPAEKDLAVVDSNETPAATNGPESRVSRVADSAAPVDGGNNFPSGTTSGIGGAAGTSSLAREIDMCELTVTSSPGTCSEASASLEQSSRMPAATATAIMTAGDRKRKGREADANTTTDCRSEDLDFECTDAKKQACGSTSAKRSRAAEVHNLSERRRRDRINEKMKALQELIPRCNKSDKASMLDEAIEYLKSLQMQVQMMSMGCSMVPMMFPGVQQYMPPMALGMGMGVGVGMGMNRAVVPYPAVLPGSAMPVSSAAGAHLAPRFPVPAFQMPPVPVADPSRTGPMSSSDPRMNSYVPQNPNQARMPCFADPYQHYLSFQQAQLPLSQAQAVMHVSTTKASSSKDANPEHQQAG